MDTAAFHLWNRLPAVATFVTSATLSVFRNWTLFVICLSRWCIGADLLEFGHEVLCFAASGSDLAVDTHRQIAKKLDATVMALYQL